MNTINHYKLTKNTLFVTNPIRLQGYTSNGFWLIDSTYEPFWMQELVNQNYNNQPMSVRNEREDMQTRQMKALTSVTPWNESAYKRMVNTNHINTTAYAQPLVKMESPSFWSWVNARYLALFLKQCKGIDLHFWQKNSNSPLYIFDREKIIGILMPCRIESEN